MDVRLTTMSVEVKHGLRGLVVTEGVEPLITLKYLGRGIQSKYLKPIGVGEQMTKVLTESATTQHARLKEILKKEKYSQFKNYFGKVNPKFTHTIRGGTAPTQNRPQMQRGTGANHKGTRESGDPNKTRKRYN